MTEAPVICFGQQPCGFLPRRFLVAKIRTARRLQAEIGGRIVFFYHDSDHDPRETQTIVRDLETGEEQHLNFHFANKIQKKYSPLYVKQVCPDWQADMARQFPKFVSDRDLCEAFQSVRAGNVADFCLEMYRALGLLEGMEIARSGDPAFREAACSVEDFFVDVPYEGETVRARLGEDHSLRLHRGGSAYIDLPDRKWTPAQVSPTRDTRLRWMQSVVQCTHYVAGAGEMNYLDTREAPGVEFIRREEISDSSHAYIPS